MLLALDSLGMTKMCYEYFIFDINSDHFSLVNNQNAYIYPKQGRVCDNNIGVHCDQFKNATDLFKLSAYTVSGRGT